MTQYVDGQERSVGRLLAEATRDLSGLVRDEIALAKAELKDDVKAVSVGAPMVVVAALLAAMAGILLTFALVYLLVTLGLNTALSFLLVAVLFLLGAGLFALLGLRKLKKVGPPQRTIATTKESVAVLKGGSSALPAQRR